MKLFHEHLGSLLNYYFYGIPMYIGLWSIHLQIFVSAIHLQIYIVLKQIDISVSKSCTGVNNNYHNIYIYIPYVILLHLTATEFHVTCQNKHPTLFMTFIQTGVMSI